MPKGFTEREKALIRASFLEQGRELFATYGLRKTAIEDLTKAVGISKGAFYLFFESKEQLFFELLEQFESDFRALLLKHITLDNDTPKVRMRALLYQAIALWKRNVQFVHIPADDYEHLLRKLPPELLKLHESRQNAFAIEFAAAWEKSGVQLRVEPRLLAGLLRALFFVTLHENDYDEGMYESIVKAHIDMFIHYVLP
jgi:AcrR family transcriptional regulator